MRSLLVFFFTFFSSTLFAQMRLGVFAGTSNYMGDLVKTPYVSTRGAFGLTATFPLSDHFSLRAGLTFAKVAGADSLNAKAEYRVRNLSFQSPITEYSLVAQYNLFNIDDTHWTPYAFAGVAVFHFNPFTYDGQQKVYLQPLGTEGQGIAGYNRQPYALTNIAIPVGGGVKFALSESVSLGIEAGLRKTFTDYLDDVSTAYVNPGDLLKVHGQEAVNLSYRGDELPGGTALYPASGTQRGGPKVKDYYYFTGLHLTFVVGSGDGIFHARGKRGYGCPNNKVY